MTREQTVAQFHRATGLPLWTDFEADVIGLRRRLLREEFEELDAELEELQRLCNGGKNIPIQNLINTLKEFADLQYVLSGAAVTFGFPLDTAFNRVHESNMSKLDDDGKPVKDTGGKVLKGPNYRPPFLEDLVE